VDDAGHIYVAGYFETSAGSALPCYWVDGTRYVLPLALGGTGGGASGITLDKSGNIFIAGSGVGAPCYWRNGTVYTLSLGSGVTGFANHIAIDSQGNLYITGRINTTDSGNLQQPCFWKNGVLTPLSVPPGDTYGNAGSVTVGS
jgi:hypothetical protein